MKFTAEQFDPSKPYPAWAWCHGEFTFYCATARGHVKLHNHDWSVEFENGERIVVSNATYQDFFAGLLAPQEAVVVEVSSSDNAEPASGVELVAREDPKPRKQRHRAKRSDGLGVDTATDRGAGE